MRQATLPVGELGVLAVTRAMAGTGAGLLLANKLRPSKRVKIGWPLLLIGAISTAPLVIDIVRRNRVAQLEDEPVSKGR